MPLPPPPPPPSLQPPPSSTSSSSPPVPDYDKNDQQAYPLTPDLLATFKRDGVVVLPNVFTAAEIEAAKAGLAETLHKHGVDIHNLEETAGNLRKLSTTGGSGGVIDLYYPEWKLKLAQNPRFFSAISQLWAGTYASYSNQEQQQARSTNAVNPSQHANGEEIIQDDHLYAHPFGPFDPSKGYFYLDRIGVRVPDTISQLHGKGKKPLQRSLTPHLDCCPAALYDAPGKTTRRWRPIQSMIALTDNVETNTGGFECVKGFHRQFHGWAQRRPPSVVVTGRGENIGEKKVLPAPCVGDFTPIRPAEDADVIERFEPVFYPAGSVVAFDWRTPHANSSKHVGVVPRQVCYGSFLPAVEVNRGYALRQRTRFLKSLQPDDQWREDKDKIEEGAGEEGVALLSPLGKQLLGLDLV